MEGMMTATKTSADTSNDVKTPAPPAPTVAAGGAAPAPVPLRINEVGEVLQGSMHIPVNGRQKTDVSGYETVLVDGQLEGSVENVEWFSLAREGKFTGNADVAYADLSGEFDGDIHCRQKLIVRSTARVTGKLSASVVEIHPGAILGGTVESYGRNPQALASPRSQPAGGDKSGKWRNRLGLWAVTALLVLSGTGMPDLL
jgi:cytoskeletal protein CcmA (bactofilin family)